MMWDEVMARVKEIILIDPTLVNLIGEAYRKAGASDLKIPVIEWTLLGDTENELWAPMLVQFDCWGDVAADVRRMEFRLRTLFHNDVPIRLSGVLAFTDYVDANDLATPNRANYVGRGVRFRFTPLRRKYALPGTGDDPLLILDGGPP